jgi:hypothetical protein
MLQTHHCTSQKQQQQVTTRPSIAATSYVDPAIVSMKQTPTTSALSSTPTTTATQFRTLAEIEQSMSQKGSTATTATTTTPFGTAPHTQPIKSVTATTSHTDPHTSHTLRSQQAFPPQQPNPHNVTSNASLAMGPTVASRMSPGRQYKSPSKRLQVRDDAAFG